MATDFIADVDPPDSDPVGSGNVTIENSLKAGESGMELEEGGKFSLGEVELGAKNSTKYGYNGSITYGAEQYVTVGDTTVKSAQELGLGKELELKEKLSVTQKLGLHELENSVEHGFGTDGKKITYGVSGEVSEKVGTEETYTKNTYGGGAKIGTDGAMEMEASQGVEAKAGGVEASMKHTSTTGFGTEEMSNGETGESVSHTEKVEMGAKAEVADGVKVSHSESVEIGTKTAESENASMEETTVAFESKTRIEVDAQKAGVGAATAAGVFNTAMATKEAIMKELFKLTSKSESVTQEETKEQTQESTQEPEEKTEKTEETEEVKKEEPAKTEETGEDKQQAPPEEESQEAEKQEPKVEETPKEDNGEDLHDGIGY